MTPEQHQLIEKAKEHIRKVRKYLDDAMYYTEPQMVGDEFKRTREAYDSVCHANDLLP